MLVDIIIDRFTDCLVERESGMILETSFVRLEEPIPKRRYAGWKLDWDQAQKDDYTVYELSTKGSSVVEGRISLKMDGGVADIDIVETAPHNFGHNGRYEGVEAHLFAIACLISKEAGCDELVAFNAKSNLVEYYIRTLNAKISMGRRMYLDGGAAKVLLGKYMKMQEVNDEKST